MRILHISNWYPNQWNSHNSPFIKEHFNACDNYVDQQLWHVQVRHEGAWFRIYKGNYSDQEHYLILDTCLRSCRLLELLTVFLVTGLRLKLARQSWDLVTVHIAYPLLRFPGLFKLLFGKKIVIIEHWSAYRQKFFLPAGSKALRRMQRMFHYRIPVITVSKALMNDIVRFSDNAEFAQYIVPNVVDPLLFHPVEKKNEPDARVFLMAGNWALIKRPLLVMEAFSLTVTRFPDMKLRIIGYGQQWEEMEEFVLANDLNYCITLLGAKNKKAVAREMQQADGFLHASDYETFSVVCAEALCCGTPVIASNVGGITEFIDPTNGLLVENTLAEWTDAITIFGQTAFRDVKKISDTAKQRFNPDAIGRQLTRVFKQVDLDAERIPQR